MPNSIHFKLNPGKALETILWIANRNGRRGVDLYKLVKTILYADMYHLNKYGRTIYGEVYLAMAHGPVPEHAYEIIKKEPLAVSALKSVPLSKSEKMVKPKRTAHLSALSKSDIEALTEGWKVCKDLSFSELKSAADSLPCYVKTWEARTSDSDEIDLADMLDEKNKDKVDELREVAPSISI